MTLIPAPRSQNPHSPLPVPCSHNSLVLSSAHQCSTVALTSSMRVSLWTFQCSCNQNASFPVSRSTRLPHAFVIFLLSIPSKPTNPLSLQVLEVEANVHKMSLAITIFDCFIPTKCSLMPSFTLERTEFCNFTVSKFFKYGGTISLMEMWVRNFSMVELWMLKLYYFKQEKGNSTISFLRSWLILAAFTGPSYKYSRSPSVDVEASCTCPSRLVRLALYQSVRNRLSALCFFIHHARYAAWSFPVKRFVLSAIFGSWDLQTNRGPCKSGKISATHIKSGSLKLQDNAEKVGFVLSRTTWSWTMLQIQEYLGVDKKRRVLNSGKRFLTTIANYKKMELVDVEIIARTSRSTIRFLWSESCSVSTATIVHFRKLTYSQNPLLGCSV